MFLSKLVLNNVQYGNNSNDQIQWSNLSQLIGGNQGTECTPGRFKLN